MSRGSDTERRNGSGECIFCTRDIALAGENNDSAAEGAGDSTALGVNNDAEEGAEEGAEEDEEDSPPPLSCRL